MITLREEQSRSTKCFFGRVDRKSRKGTEGNADTTESNWAEPEVQWRTWTLEKNRKEHWRGNRWETKGDC